MKVTAQGIIERDAFVFQQAAQKSYTSFNAAIRWIYERKREHHRAFS